LLDFQIISDFITFDKLLPEIHTQLALVASSDIEALAFSLGDAFAPAFLPVEMEKPGQIVLAFCFPL
jgi:hypothetical protein